MKILVVGSGGREHAILDRLHRDAPHADLHITLGNGGTAALARPVPHRPAEIRALGDWALDERIDLTIVGPEAPLADGIVDHFQKLGLPIFGPTRLAAEIESSKAFAKDLMHRHGIPTAAFRVFDDHGAAVDYVREQGAPIVVKASGLAAGKGAVVCETEEEALTAIGEMLGQRIFGDAGNQVVIEEFMTGEELSVFAVSDGENVVTLLSAQDHKRIGEGDTGPNTGGMGAYAPVSIASPQLLDRVEREILLPTIRAMALEGRPYRGFLYAGLMITPDGPKVVEFNCRFGDPEAQVVLPLMGDSLLELVGTVANGGSFGRSSVAASLPGAAVTTVLASGGYPGAYSIGVPIHIPPDLESDPRIRVYHAATKVRDGGLVTDGGRVMAVTALAATVEGAAELSREAASRIEFAGRTFRRDIGWREVARRSRKRQG